ncbi:MAG: proton-conducting transporter membrane subunit [Marinilabiliaceae bacterium]
MLNYILSVYIVFAIVLGGLQLVNRRKALAKALVALFVLGQWALTAYALLGPSTPSSEFFSVDALAKLLTLVVSIISSAAFCHSNGYIVQNEQDKDAKVRAQSYGAMTILTMALTMAGVSAHLAVTWIFIEITTLCASALIFYRRTQNSIEATWKYVFACSISLVLVYVGILLASISMGEDSANGLSFAALGQAADKLDDFWLKLSFIFIFVGYTAKMGLVPMFTAGIDAKDAAPAPAAAVLSSIVMNAGFVGFYRFYAVVQHTAAARWAMMVVLVTGVVSVFVAAVYLVKVHNVKRLFAYSSVEHIGVVAIGVACGGVGLYAAILHLVLHSFAKSAIMMHVGNLFRVFGTKQMNRMGRYIDKTHSGAAILILGLLCITAMPPSGLFITELMIFKALISAHLWVVLAILAVLLCTIVWAMSRDTFSILFLPAEEPLLRKEASQPFPWTEAAWQFALLGLSIWWGLWTPDFISSLVSAAAAI